MKKVNLNKERCIGCGMCCSVASENFTFDDEGRASLISETVTDEAIEMSEMCPVNAISIIEDKCNCKECNCEESCDCSHECNCGEDCNCTTDNKCSGNCNCNK
ncbi:MAG: ferredoxin [Bacilli bacterium]|nr:ferredoxin [Bacilli bacterium]